MDIYQRKTRWKLILLGVATIIVLASLWYTHRLAQQLANEERKRVKLWANAYKQINLADKNTDITFYFKVIRNNETVPVILTNEEGEILDYRNLDSLKAERDTTYLKRQLQQMKESKEPIEIDIGEEKTNYIYYKESFLLTQLRYYPYVQLGIIGLFLFVAYLAFSAARKAEQNKVWVGLSKETAHQLGTPISSLLGWLEYLKSAPAKEYSKHLPKLEKDVKRLEQITDRFSKIGSRPSLQDTPLKPLIKDSIEYLRQRSSDQIEYQLDIQPESIRARVNPTLFEWVIENLLKNALNAMNGDGIITIKVHQRSGTVYIDVSDTGKGIPKSQQKTIFKPGYTTRSRGWGLGLTLTKRIVEYYHQGKIYVYSSTPGEGTTFRIELKQS